MKLHLVRHGETDWNLEQRLQGHIIDPPISLNDKGRSQAMDTATILKDKNLEIIFSSDLHRALETAAIISDVYDINIVKNYNLREADFGIFQGELYSDESHKYFTDSALQFPEGESLDEAGYRVKEALKELSLQYNYDNAGVVTHGGIIGNLRAEIEGNPYVHVENGEVFSIEYDKEVDGFKIVE